MALIQTQRGIQVQLINNISITAPLALGKVTHTIPAQPDLGSILQIQWGIHLWEALMEFITVHLL